MTDSLSEVVPYLPTPPDWLVIAGVGTGTEVKDALARWPSVKVLGLDPDLRAVQWQLNNGWPLHCHLLTLALSCGHGEATMSLDDGVNLASLHQRQIDVAPPDKLVRVQTTTLDTLHKTYDFTNCLLWLDLEDYELPALVGAKELLVSGNVITINLEVRKGIEEETAQVAAILHGEGYEKVHEWFHQWWGHNEVWRLI